MMIRLQLLHSPALQSFFYKLLVLLAVLLCSARLYDAHNDGAPAVPCKSDRGVTVEAAFRPGIITVDADSRDWADVEGHQFPLRQAINPDSSEKFPMDPGSIQIKAVHDGRDVFFNLEVPGDYVFKDGAPTSCPAVALMFGVGDDATYHNVRTQTEQTGFLPMLPSLFSSWFTSFMCYSRTYRPCTSPTQMGGCPVPAHNCSSTSCHGYDVDIMQFSISTAIPGRLYGSNIHDNLEGIGSDRFGNLNDLFGWSPHCKYFDGAGPDATEVLSGAQNDWTGAWTHTSIPLEYGLVKGDSPFATDGTKGFYIFEFARPLRTNDRLQQDVQFTIGGTFPFGAAVWYPVNDRPWGTSQHYSANCAWIPLKLSAASGSSLSSWRVVDILSILSILVAFAALGTTLVLGWWVKSNNPQLGFQGIPNL